MAIDFSTHEWAYSTESLVQLQYEVGKAGEERIKAKNQYEFIYNRKDAMLAKIMIRVRNDLVAKGHKKPTVLQIEGYAADDQEFLDFHAGLLAASNKFDEADHKFKDLKMAWETCRTVLADRRSEKTGGIKDVLGNW